MDQTDISLLQLPGYTLILQSGICSSHGGLAIYLHDTFNYTFLPINKRSTIWEGLFIEIDGKRPSRNMIIGDIKNMFIYILGYMYRPRRDYHYIINHLLTKECSQL